MNVRDILENILLLEGKTWDNYWKNMSKESRNKFDNDKFLFYFYTLRVDPTATNKYIGKYIDWLLKTYFSQGYSHLGIFSNKVRDALTYFDKNKDKFKEKDINNYSSIIQLTNTIEKTQTKIATKRLKTETPDFSHGSWVVKKINTPEQACELGTGTKWCLTDTETFLEYKKNRDFFYVFHGNKRWAIARRRGDPGMRVYDIEDEEISENKWIDKYGVPREVVNYIFRMTK